MRIVYEAENLIDAHLFRGALEQGGIPAWVRGEHLVGAIGDLPVAGLLAVCVPEWAETEASAIVADLVADLARPLQASSSDSPDADSGATPASGWAWLPH